MPKPKVHFFICGNQRPNGHPRGSCADRNCMDVVQAISMRWQEAQMFDTVMVSVVQSCLGPCEMGPTMVVYPDNAWYLGLDPEKAARIFDSHAKEGKPVAELMAPEGTF